MKFARVPVLGPEGIGIFVISRAEVLLELELGLARHVGGVIHSWKGGRP